MSKLERSIKVKLRQDLELTQRSMQYEDFWIVKDPIAFTHFMFSGHEFQLLQLFDGNRTDEDVQRLWQQRFRTQSLTLQQVRDFTSRLIRDNLVVVDEFGYGGSLHNTQQAKRNQQVMSLLVSPLVIRFRGINPSFLLDSLSWFGWVLFHPVVIALLMCCSSFVLVYMLGHFEELSYRLPAISQLLSAQGLLSIAITLSIVKILHELGHAMACRRCGGECFEIGLILLAFIPTLYCNVSDAWTFPQRWKRMLVSFAGVYVEILLSAIAAVVWLNTDPGLLNAVMFNVVMLCAINSVLVNGNPLLRYDGYYLLSDFMEQPNLNIVSRDALGQFVYSSFFVPNRQKSYPVWIVVYAILSFLYRWFVVISIFVLIYFYLKGVGLRVVGQYVMLFLGSGILWRTMMANPLFRKRTRSAGRFSLARAGFPLFSLGLLAAVFFFVPFGTHVRCNLVVNSEAPTDVYVPSNGKLTSVSTAFSTVAKGQVIARIESIEIDQKLRQTRNSLSRHKNLLKQWSYRVNEDPLAASQIAVTQKNIEAENTKLRLLEDELARLNVLAPQSGVIHPAPDQAEFYVADGQAKKWQGNLLDDKNLNCYVQRGDHLLAIQSADKKTVTLFVGEREIDELETGQPLVVMFSQCPGQTFDGLVGAIFKVDVDVNDVESADTGVETYVNAAGKLQSLQTPYRVVAELESIPTQAFAGSGGRARISVTNKTLAQKTMEFFDRLAKFNL